MDFLSVTGNTSAVPYTKNECSLYSDNGQCFIYKGRAVVTDGGDYYDVVVYDGIIDFYKEIENKALPYLGLEGLTHNKTLQTVKDTWHPASVLPYRYIIADYNGNYGPEAVNGNTIDIDYLVPCVSVEWLWKKIFEKFGFTYSGAVFNTHAFKDLWLTYPKGVTTDDQSPVVFESEDFRFHRSPPNQGESFYAVFTEAEQQHYSGDNIHIYVETAGQYKITLNGGIALNYVGLYGRPPFFRLYIAKNAIGKWASQTTAFKEVLVYPRNLDFTTSVIVSLEAGESVAFVVVPAPGYSQPFSVNYDDSWMKAKIQRFNNTVSFTDTLADFSIRDFATEIMHRFGLTMFREKYDRLDAAAGTYKPHYNFLTLAEHLQTADITDWSDKFSGKEKETYMHGSYAQQNWFRYNYNDKEGSYLDACIPIENVNLPEQKDVIKSKIYAPEKMRRTLLNNISNIYKLWEKEVKEDTDEVNYKPLDKRYYLMRSKRVNTGITLKSSMLGGQLGSPYYVFESFTKMAFNDIIQDYYGPLGRLLDKSVIVTASMYLTDDDVCNFDFRKLYYISRLSNYFIVNKINNYIPGKPVKCDLVRVLYNDVTLARMPLRITKVLVFGYSFTVHYENQLGLTNLILQIDYENPRSSYFPYSVASSPTYGSTTPSGKFIIYLKTGEYRSNEVLIETGYGISSTITPLF